MSSPAMRVPYYWRHPHRGRFRRSYRQTIASDPEANWIFIVDQLNTHKSESLVRLVAEVCGLDWIWALRGKGHLEISSHTS